MDCFNLLYFSLFSSTDISFGAHFLGLASSKTSNSRPYAPIFTQSITAKKYLYSIGIKS